MVVRISLLEMQARRSGLSYLLLLHQLRVWTVVNHVRSEDWRGQLAIHFFSVDILEFPIENEFVSLYS